MLWNRICCPVDFSRESRCAMEEAVDLARRSGGELTLLHVDDRQARPGADETLASPAALDRGTLELERALGEWADLATRLLGRPVGFGLLAGVPSDQIVSFARDRGVDVIVMGTHGRSGRAAALGSVAAAVARDGPCSVLVVRGTGPAASGPAAG